tara:strand:- start:4320 stop:6338 length:2019 start_codon:yes stop_codon:yes gene_type:complete
MASIYELAQQINRGKQSSQGGDNQFFDNSMRVMQHLEERSKEGTARKVKGMEVALGDFNKIYDNKTLNDRMQVFENRFGGKNLNKLNADERAAYDNAKIMMTRQMDKNTDFSMYQNKLKDTTKAMNDWMTSADGETQPDPDAMNEILLDYMETRANFSTNHQDRLSSQAFSYLNKEMDSIHEMGTFGIASMANDGILSEAEGKAMGQSLTSLDPKFISEFKIERKRTQAEGHAQNKALLESTMKEHDLYKDIMNRVGTDNRDGRVGYRDAKDNFIPMTKIQAKNLYLASKEKLGNLDDKYKNNINNPEGKSFLEMSGFGHIANEQDPPYVDPNSNIDQETNLPYAGGENEALQESVEGEIVEGDDTTGDDTTDDGGGISSFINEYKEEAAVGTGIVAIGTQIPKVQKAVDVGIKFFTETTGAPAKDIVKVLKDPDVKTWTNRINVHMDKIDEARKTGNKGKLKNALKAYQSTVNKAQGVLGKRFKNIEPKDMLKLLKGANKWNFFKLKKVFEPSFSQVWKTTKDLKNLSVKSGWGLSPVQAAILGWSAGDKLGLGVAGQTGTAITAAVTTKKLMSHVASKGGWKKAIQNPQLQSKVGKFLLKKAPGVAAKMGLKAGAGAIANIVPFAGQAVSAGMLAWTASDIYGLMKQFPELKEYLVEYVNGEYDEEKEEK